MTYSAVSVCVLTQWTSHFAPLAGEPERSISRIRYEIAINELTAGARAPVRARVAITSRKARQMGVSFDLNGHRPAGGHPGPVPSIGALGR